MNGTGAAPGNPLQPPAAAPAGSLGPAGAPPPPAQDEAVVAHGRSFSSAVNAQLFSLEQAYSDKGVVREIFHDLTESTHTPEGFQAKKTEILKDIDARINLLDSEKKNYWTTTKKVILVALAFLTAGISVPIAYMLHSKGMKQFAADKAFHKALLDTVTQMDQDAVYALTDWKAHTLQPEPGDSRPVKLLLGDNQRINDAPVKTGKSELPVPNYLAKDFPRIHSMKISLQNGPAYKSTAGKEPENDKKGHVGKFVDDVLSGMQEVTAFGNKKERECILQNALTGFHQNAFVEATLKVQVDNMNAGTPRAPAMPSAEELSELSGGKIDPLKTLTSAYSVNINEQGCTQVATGILMLRDESDLENSALFQYQVVITENRIPLDAMKKDAKTLAKTLDPTKGQVDLDTSTSRMMFSQAFNTPEEAVAYFNETRPFAENGTLFDLLEQVPGDWAAPNAAAVPPAQAPVAAAGAEEVRRLDDDEINPEELPPPPPKPG